jgi:hypothetical protein
VNRRFHSASLEHFVERLGKEDENRMNKLASDPSTDMLQHSALHMAACNPDSTSLG